jgi:hypothetical protein
MIEPLTKEKLTEYGFDEETINRCLTENDYECGRNIDTERTYRVRGNKIYSGKEAWRIDYFERSNIGFPFQYLSLVPDYYNLKEQKYLNEKKEKTGIIFDLEFAKKTFKNNEITETKNIISEIKKDKLYNHPFIKGRNEAVNKYEWYLNWLNTKDISQPQQLIPPINWDEYFISIEVWNVFIKLVEVIVNSKPQKENWANYSAIFQTLIDKKLVHKLGHKKFLNYCDSHHNTDFSAKTKLKSNTSNHSTELIKSYLKSAKLIQS